MYKILVVDDNVELISYLEMAAKGDGRTVFTADNGVEAIGLINEYEFNVIVTDLRMDDNELAGLDVLRAAKEKSIYTQVILITVFGTPEISVETMRLGAFDYLERNNPRTDVLMMVKAKITLALEFGEAKRMEHTNRG